MSCPTFAAPRAQQEPKSRRRVARQPRHAVKIGVIARQTRQAVRLHDGHDYGVVRQQLVRLADQARFFDECCVIGKTWRPS